MKTGSEICPKHAGFGLPGSVFGVVSWKFWPIPLRVFAVQVCFPFPESPVAPKEVASIPVAHNSFNIAHSYGLLAF